jgi:activating signal cointegrator complex subunit 3
MTNVSSQVVDSLKRGYQVMVFVHSRKDTGKTARWIADTAASHGETALFLAEDHPRLGLLQKEVRK